MSTKSAERILQEMRQVYENIVGFTDDFCQAHLNQEYAGLCRKLAAALCRKRPSPLKNGEAKV